MALSIKDTLNNANRQNFINTIKPQAVSVSEMIANEEAETAKSSADKLSQYLSDRSEARKAISSGALKTGRPAEDAFNVRMGKLVDLYIDAASKETDENGKPIFTSEQLIEKSKNIPEAINSMKQYYNRYAPDRVWAIDDYLQKGGTATNVFNYLEDMYGTRGFDNPYGVKGKEAQKVSLEGLGEGSKGVVSTAGFLPNVATKAGGQILSKLENSKLFQRADEKLYDSYHKVWDTASDEEYRKYKSGQLGEGSDIDKTSIMSGESKRSLYDQYDKALSEGFVGSVNEYKDYLKKTRNIASEATINSMKEGLISKDDIESSKGAIIGETIAEFLTYMFMPFKWKSGAKGIVEVDTARPLLNKIATATSDAIINTMDYAALEGAQGEIKEGDLGRIGLVNLLISSVLRGVGPSSEYTSNPAYAKLTKEGQKFIRSFLSTLPDRVKKSFENMDSKTLKELRNFAQREAQDPDARGLTAKWLGEKGVKAVEKLGDDITNLGKEYGDKISKLDTPVSEKGFFDEINSKFKELEDQGAVSWGEGKAPKLELIKEDGSYKVNIENKDNLNRIKNEEGKGLGDAIQENVEAILEGYGIGLNQGSQYLIKQGVRNATKGTQWNVYEQQTRKLIEGLDNWELDMPQDVKDLGNEIYYKKNLLNLAKKDLGIEGKYEAGKFGQDLRYEDVLKAGKNMGKDDAIAIVDILKREGYLPDNMNSEILAQAYLLGIENKDAAYSFLEGYYPSKAGGVEQILELARQHATRAEIERVIGTLEKQEKLAAMPKGVGSVESIKNPRAEIERALGGGLLYNQPDRKRIEQSDKGYSTEGMSEMDKYELNRKYMEMYGK